MNTSSPMKKLFSIGGAQFLSFYWADKYFTKPGLYIWFRKGYIVRPR